MSVFILILFAASAMAQHKTLHDFTGRDIAGKTFDFSTLKGKKVMVVNTASRCSLTPQYKKLQQLYEEYGSDEFEIIAFPSNDFFNREPGTNKEIKEFCTTKYGVSFPVMAKIHVRGDSIHPVYQWLTSGEENGVLDKKVLWNFQKYLIEKDGIIYDCLGPTARPYSNKVIEWILSE